MYIVFPFGIDIMTELSRREKAAGILPDPDIDTYMKASFLHLFILLCSAEYYNYPTLLTFYLL